MRYVVALLVAGLVIAALAAFSWWNYNAVERSVPQHLRQQKERGDLPPDRPEVDPESLDLRDYNVRVPRELMFRQDFARFLAALWYVWAPAVVGIALGIEALVGRWRSRAEPGPTADRPLE
jgi:hypothetical protein